MDYKREPALLSCTEVLARHSDYIDGLLDADDAESLRSHIAACDDCARYDRVLRRGLGLLGSASDVEPDLDFTARLHSRIAQEEQRRARPIATTTAASVSVAAMLALAIWVPFAFFPRGDATAASPADATTSEIAWHAEPVTPEATHAKLVRRDIRLAAAHPHISLIGRNYTPLVVESPIAPPSYSTVSFTTLRTR